MPVFLKLFVEKSCCSSWHRRVWRVVCPGDALAVLLQFIHAAIISQTLVLYNKVI